MADGSCACVVATADCEPSSAFNKHLRMLPSPLNASFVQLYGSELVETTSEVLPAVGAVVFVFGLGSPGEDLCISASIEQNSP